MPQVEFKFARDQKVRAIDGRLDGEVGRIQVASCGWSGTWYHVLFFEDTQQAEIVLFYESRLEPVDDPKPE